MKKESIRKLRLGGRLLLGIYLACLIYFMFFSESYGRTAVNRDYHYNLVLFREIRRFVQYRHVLGTTAVLINVAGNVAVFVPLGFALPVLFERIHSFGQVLILSFAISLLAETMQLVLRVGCFDVDDLFLNTVGGCIGYLGYRILRRYFWKRGSYGEEKL
ncbi:MAG: VanZ family protein [Lachnospiraceae bacterium]|jgi:glycopeptide antibiotics resistance protein|nr:VanZ family protein [Lachnospiraceae bacterium]MCI9250956.1 VanZ family protein [Lachnospiraceae bacterium]MCI9384295.1 VanZ family protein [Lachnospiraceae bacterium]MCI9480316.1 VanZ family protein [Lachnospiraceae bacterium]MCI9624176.1 VanZ family protein [Lachnospiraceae bacterium]